MSDSQIIIYQTENGQTKIDVRLENETVWLTQKAMADLFQTTIPNINMHFKNIFEEGELESNRTIKDFLIVQLEGKREVNRTIVFYNLINSFKKPNFVNPLVNTFKISWCFFYFI